MVFDFIFIFDFFGRSSGRYFYSGRYHVRDVSRLVLMFCSYSSASSSVIVCSKDVWDCLVVELVVIGESLGGGGNILFDDDVFP